MVSVYRKEGVYDLSKLVVNIMFLKRLSIAFLNAFNDVELTSSLDRLFHSLITLLVKKTLG